MLPSRRSPRPTLCRRGVRNLGWRWRDCAGKRDPAKCCWLCGGVGMRDQPTLRFSLRCEAGRRLCFPGSRTRDVICNAAHCRIPLAREPSANGFPPSPRATTRPTARFIKDNIVLCPVRLLHCPAVCKYPHLALVRAASGTVRRHPSCQRRRAAKSFEVWPGRGTGS
jgi:hypothetical protein